MKLKVGEMIKRLRKEREITQEEFAENNFWIKIKKHRQHPL